MPIAKKTPENGGNFRKKLKKITDFDKLLPDGTKSVTFLTKKHLIGKNSPGARLTGSLPIKKTGKFFPAFKYPKLTNESLLVAPI